MLCSGIKHGPHDVDLFYGTPAATTIIRQHARTGATAGHAERSGGLRKPEFSGQTVTEASILKTAGHIFFGLDLGKDHHLTLGKV